MEKEKKIRTSIMLDKDVMEWLQVQSKKQDRSISNVANKLIKEGIKKQSK